MNEHSEQLAQVFAAKSKERADAIRSRIRELAQQRATLTEGTERADAILRANRHVLEGAPGWTTDGYVDVGAGIIQVTLHARGSLSDTERLQFSGESWGAAFGGGLFYGGFDFSVPKEQVVGSCSWQLVAYAGVAGGIEVTWWRPDFAFLGVFIGVGAGVLLGSVGGDGGIWQIAPTSKGA
jgi:hypothetical protein